MESAEVFSFADEGLDHADARDVLSHGGDEAGLGASETAVGLPSAAVEPVGDPGQKGKDRAHGQAQAQVVLHHEHYDAHQGDEAGEGLPSTPGEDPVQRIDVGVGPGDNPALVGSVKIVEREALDVLEDGQTQVVHGSLARLDGGADLNDGQPPSQQQIG